MSSTTAATATGSRSPASPSRPTTSSAASGSRRARALRRHLADRRARCSPRSRGRGRRRSTAPSVAAHDAFPAWAGARRRRAAPTTCRRLADLIDANVDRLAAVECEDMAMLLRSLRARVIARGARNYRAYADLAVAYEERDWRSNGTWNRVQRMPAGPAAVITPWNAPFMLSTWKTAPALAAGCTVVLKPAEWSPLSCSLLADLVAEAGLPARRLQRRSGDRRGGGRGARRAPAGPSRLVHRLARDGAADRRRGGPEHRSVHRRARRQEPLRRLRGRRPRRGRAQGGRPVRRRGPGVPRRNPPPRPGERLATSSSRGSTPTPTSTCSGDPRDDAPRSRRSSTPTTSPASRASSSGRARPATAIVRGGRRAELGGLWYEPTLVEPRSNDAEIVQREVFGPVLTIQTFRDEAEAIELANSTEYGLSAIVYTGSTGPRRPRRPRRPRAARSGSTASSSAT